MPTVVGATVRTLLDFAKSLDPDGRIAKVVELLNIQNEILLDMLWREGNLPTGHRTTIRTGLPTATWRLLNKGVTPSKSQKSQIDEQCGLLEAWSEVDCEEAKLNGDVGAYRLSEAYAFIEAMNQSFSSTLFYGSAVTPEQFIGLAPRYSSLTAGNSENIIDGGGVASDNTSVWLIGWGENTVMGLFPKGSVAGLVHNDLGEQTILTDATGGIGTGRMRVYQDQFVWKSGITVKDWRYASRLCNIDSANLVAETNPTDLTNKMIRMINRFPTMANIKPAFYMNRTVFEMLDIQRREGVQLGGQLRYEQIDGQVIPTFRGIPIRRCDSILNTETRVT